MNNDKQNTQPYQTAPTAKSSVPDDKGNIVISGFVRISDPQTEKTILEVREC